MGEFSLEKCDPRDIIEKISNTLQSPEWSKWLNETMQAFAAALTGVAEKRMTDAVAALFLAQVGSSFYAATRMLGQEPEDALKEAQRDLCKVYTAALWLLRQSFDTGTLEENYKNALSMIAGGKKSGEDRKQ
jgi:arginyl-tRNA synthetase